MIITVNTQARRVWKMAGRCQATITDADLPALLQALDLLARQGGTDFLLELAIPLLAARAGIDVGGADQVPELEYVREDDHA